MSRPRHLDAADEGREVHVLTAKEDLTQEDWNLLLASAREKGWEIELVIYCWKLDA